MAEMASSQLQTLARSLDLPGMRRFENVTFVLLFLATTGLIGVVIMTQEESLLTVGGSILGSVVILGGGLFALRWGSTALARRHIERLLASLPDGPSRVDYFELIGREASPRAVEVEVEVDATRRRRYGAIEHAIRERFPGVTTTWQADTLTARSPGYACERELDLDDEGRVTIHDNGPLHAFFVGVLACTGPTKRVRVREVTPGRIEGDGASATARRARRRKRR
jgi:hypothetical protein